MPDCEYLPKEMTRKLKSLVILAGTNISEVATKMGMSRAVLSARLNGRTDFSRAEMFHFASLVGGKPGGIFFDE